MAKKKKTKKLTKFGNILLDIIIVIAIGIAAFSGYNLYLSLKEYKDSDNAYAEIAENAVEVAPPAPNEEGQPQEESFSPAISINFETLKNTNPDFRGWVYLADSAINYPIVQGMDNSYYLDHLFTGEYNHSGCVFIDYRNDGFNDTNTVLYAHHMRNGTMFADVVKYKDQAYYNAHKQIEIYTEGKTYVMYPVAGIYTTGSEEYVQTNFESDDAYMNYVNRFLRDSTFTSEQTITPQDKMMMLSTCSYNVEDGRYVLIGKLVEQ